MVWDLESSWRGDCILIPHLLVSISLSGSKVSPVKDSRDVQVKGCTPLRVAVNGNTQNRKLPENDTDELRVFVNCLCASVDDNTVLKW